PESETMDIEGWDLTKVLRLMRKSNTTVFEWLQSPICYSEKDNFRQELWTLAQNYFCAKSNMHHYLGIAKGAMETVINENTIKIKKLFYVLRPLLAAKWCFEKQGIAPMSIFPLLQLLPVHLREDISRLIAMKETASEGFVISIEPVLLNYLKSELQSCTDHVQQLEKVTADSKPLNNFFKKILQRYDY
ncbi:MAG: nucleotidyltransferase domain-containing protein, partial [Chitinophagaceae bacterium]|nr:nucleotidyltransferase domain-containing protein [Chitinophagaceae bacterium]